MKPIYLIFLIFICFSCAKEEVKNKLQPKETSTINKYTYDFNGINIGKIFQINDALGQKINTQNIAWSQTVFMTQTVYFDFINIRMHCMRCYENTFRNPSSEIYYLMIFENLKTDEFAISIADRFFYEDFKGNQYRMFESTIDFTEFENLLANTIDDSMYKSKEMLNTFENISDAVIYEIYNLIDVYNIHSSNLDSIFVEMENKKHPYKNSTHNQNLFIKEFVESESCFVYAIECFPPWHNSFYEFAVFSFTNQYGEYFDAISNNRTENLLKNRVNINVFIL